MNILGLLIGQKLFDDITFASVLNKKSNADLVLNKYYTIHIASHTLIKHFIRQIINIFYKLQLLQIMRNIYFICAQICPFSVSIRSTNLHKKACL